MVAVTYGSARVPAARAKAPSKQKGFFARFWAALLEARMQQAHREIRLHQHLFREHKVEPAKRFGR